MWTPNFKNPVIYVVLLILYLMNGEEHLECNKGRNIQINSHLQIMS